MERTGREFRRRSLVITIFPTTESWVRLATRCRMEYSKDWGSDRSYIKKEIVQEALDKNLAFLTAQTTN